MSYIINIKLYINNIALDSFTQQTIDVKCICKIHLSKATMYSLFLTIYVNKFDYNRLSPEDG